MKKLSSSNVHGIQGGWTRAECLANPQDCLAAALASGRVKKAG